MDIFSQIREEARKILLNARGSHGWEHTERVYKLCLHIGEKENADMEILKLAAILHDIARPEEDKSNGRVCHAMRGAELAGKILERRGLDKEKISKILHCIGSHRFRNEKRPETREARVLFDADKLDSIGAVGIGRAFLFAGEVGAKLHNKGTDIEKTKPYTEEDTAYREFMVKLRKLKGMMLTREGRRMAEGRHRFMVEFFGRLDREVDGEL